MSIKPYIVAFHALFLTREEWLIYDRSNLENGDTRPRKQEVMI